MKQITILCNECGGGAIASVTQILADAGVNIESIAGEQYGTQAVVTATVDETETALAALKQHGKFQAIAEDALLLRVEDELGALAKIARKLEESNIAIRSIRFVERHDGYALVAVSTNDSAAARAVMDKKVVS